jgi:putative N6-adenine-specific DNA methylase
MRCFATCAFGVEALVRDELTALGLEVIAVEDARVVFEAQREGIIRANLWLRCADRVFVELNSFPADTFTALFDGLRPMEWHKLLPADAAITVTGKTALSKLVSIRDVQKIAKKAICDSMCRHHGYDQCPETGQPYHVEIGFLRDRATIGLNTSGAGLNRRGYRDLSVQAPLRETLAAAMVMLSHYSGSEIFIDPCCGSGTIAIEAAMIVARVAPGLFRRFAFDEWKQWTEDAQRLREEASAQKRSAGFAHLYAYDIDPESVSMSRRHARRAGVHGLINFETVDIKDLTLPAENCVIVTNPPYGERMKTEEARAVELTLGKIKRENPRAGMFVISSDPMFETNFGAKADRRRKLYNGNIQCQLFMYRRERKRQDREQESE